MTQEPDSEAPVPLERELHIVVDEEANAAYVRFTDASPARTLAVHDDGRVIATLDFSDDGRLVGLELLDAKSQLGLELDE